MRVIKVIERILVMIPIVVGVAVVAKVPSQDVASNR